MKIVNDGLLYGRSVIVRFTLFSILLVSIFCWADDTDIYLNQNASTSDKPMIMFSLDYRSSLGNTVCSDDEYDEFGDPEDDTACASLVREGYLADTAIRHTGNYTSLEIYRALLKKVMEHDLGDGLKIKDVAIFGMMMNHKHNKNCDGPNQNDCSNGGYMLSKFRDLSVAANYIFFFDALENIPIPNLNWNDITGGVNMCDQYGSNTGEHQYQGAELFFEFFRYLTGQAVHNGHTGYKDFGTDDDENMDDSNAFLAAPYSEAYPYYGESGLPTCRRSPTWDVSAEDGSGNYVSPLVDLDDTGCGADIYTFNFMFQVSNQEDDSNCAILENRQNGGMDGIAGNLNNCRISGPKDTAGTFGVVLEFLRDTDLGVASNPYGTVPNLPGEQNIKSYFFVPPNQVDTTTNSYANAGGTTGAIPMDLSDPDIALESIVDIIEQILSVSTTFVSPTLPSNVFNRTDLLDQVYIAIFKADEDLKPRWTGNLKRLHINKEDPTNPFLAGDDGSGGISGISAVAADGRINPATLTVWTHPEDIPAPDDPSVSDYRLGKDGRSTVYGGAGGNIPGYRFNYKPGNTNNTEATTERSSRILLTEPDNRSDATLRDFNADDSTATALLQIGDPTLPPVTPVSGVLDDYKQIKIDLWQTIMPYPDCQGYDAIEHPKPETCNNYNVALELDQNEAILRLKDVLAYGRGYTELGGSRRNWFLGDPLHSKPVAVNYGGLSEVAQIVRLAVTTNDGFLHYIREVDGVEEWAFTPRSVTKVLSRLQANTVSAAPVHPYTMDSTPTILTKDVNSNGTIEPGTDKVYLYSGMRRGGKHYYALDVTDYGSPEMLWAISKDETDFSELGQTWSQPTNIFIRYDDGSSIVEKAALIFGGGYNGDDDGDRVELGKDDRNDALASFTGSDDDEGIAIFIVDAETGALIWKATGVGVGDTGPVTGDDRVYYHSEMVDSIASGLVAVNATSPEDIYDDRAYVGDTGGVVWRVDFNSQDRTEWKVSILANLGRHHIADQINDRRFFHGVDFVLSNDKYGPYDAVVMGSGNRANPLSDETDNYLYVIKDRNIGVVPNSDSSLNHAALQDLSDNCLQNDVAPNCGIGYVDFDTKMFDGWKIKLEQCTDQSQIGSCGEKGLSTPFVLFGKIIFNTYVPPLSQGSGPTCGPDEGSGQTYLLSLRNATAVEDLNASNNSNGQIVLDRTKRLNSGGIPSDPVFAGTYSPGALSSGVCPELVGILLPDLQIKQLCGMGIMKKYWYTTEPE